MRVDSFSVRLATPLGTAHGKITARDGFLITLDPVADDVDAPGIGEATPLPGWTESRTACETALRTVDSSSAPTTTIESDAPAVRHGITLAQADAAARGSGRSLARFLANRHDLPTPPNSVPVNATVGDASISETAANAKAAVENGYGCLKVKVGVRKPKADVERLRAVRSAVGDDVAVRADANGGWERKTAEQVLRKIERLDIEYVEQPVPVDDLDGLAALRRTVPEVPIAVDESLAEYTPDRILESDAADVLVLKPMVLGGPHATVTAALDAQRHGAEAVVTTTIDAVVARTAALHVAAAIPNERACGLATGDLLAEDLAPAPTAVRDGRLRVPNEPGLAGDAFDELP